MLQVRLLVHLSVIQSVYRYLSIFLESKLNIHQRTNYENDAKQIVKDEMKNSQIQLFQISASLFL